MKSLFQKPWISFNFVGSGLERPLFFFFKTEWCLLSFQLSSLAQKFPAYCLFCWICAKIWKWIILTFPSLNWDPTIFCPPHSLLFYLFWTILQCKDFCCFHISLWIEISPREVGQVEESSSTILYFSDNIAMEIFLIFSHFSLTWDPSLWGWARGRAKWVQLHHRVRSWERFSIFVEIFEKIKIF